MNRCPVCNTTVQPLGVYCSFPCKRKAEAEALASKRVCFIAGASILDSEDRGDGAYNLLDLEGNPEEIGRAIGQALAEHDLWCPADGATCDDAGQPVFLTLRVRICRDAAAHEACPKEE